MNYAADVEIRARRRAGRINPAMIVLLLAVIAIGCGGSGGSGSSSGIVHFVPNSHAFWSKKSNWTTSYGPAYADVLLQSSNFVPCRGGPFSLCYYSGPSSGNEDLSCTLTKDGKYANCLCYEIPYGVYFVDINSILNHSVYKQTIAQCGADGSLCQTLNSAPVCQNVNQGNLIPGTGLYSTFSFDCVPTDGIGQTNCSQQPYAGCMTAPCFKTDQPLIDSCSCPVFNGPYQVGQNEEACTLGDNLVWSAAYTPSAAPSSSSDSLESASSASAAAPVSQPAAVPSPPACLPDAPGSYGCPLFTEGQTLPPDSGVDCTKVCAEYNTCLQTGGIQAGYTCDATLCTDQCNDRDLVQTACQNLAGCDISEIVKAETAASCSCCASQLCNCQPTATTNAEISLLNTQQHDRGITPQCDVNGTLCGTQ